MRPTSFILQELVDPDTFLLRGDRAWELLDPRALATLQALRDHLGPCVVNNWHDGGTYRESGLRAFDSKTGAKYSQHKFGRGFDCKFKSMNPHEVLDYVQSHRFDFPHLTVVENPKATPSWFHFDTRNTNRPDIWIVDP